MNKILPVIAALTISMPLYLASPALAHGHGDHAQAWVNHMFKEIDTDNKGYITKDEYLDYAENEFDDMDTDGTGKVTKQQMLDYKRQKMSEMKAAHHGKHHAKNDQKSDETQGGAEANEASKTNSDNH